MMNDESDMVDVREKGQTHIVVKPGEAPETTRTVLGETPFRNYYRCVPVTDFRDLVMGKKKRKKASPQIISG